MKFVVEEPESEALRHAVAGEAQIASELAEVELLRAVRRRAPTLDAAAVVVLHGVTLVELDSNIRAAAGRLEPPTLRSLDAIHLATALAVGAGLDALVTYDARLGDAAEQHGLTVLAPA